MKNPFIKASKIKKCLKIGVYGSHGEGKTFFALGFPKPAVIDLEGGTDLYGSRFDFSVFHTKSFSEVMDAVKFLENEKHDFETLVIDPVTIIWEALQGGRLEWKAKNGLDKVIAGSDSKDDFNFKDWRQLKRLNNILMTRLVNLKMHLVLIGRMKDEYTTKGNQMIKVGVKMDAEKSLPYLPDICFRIETKNGRRMAIFEKDRSGHFQKDREVENISFKDFLPILEENKDGTELQHQSEEEAINKDAEFMADTETGKNEFHSQAPKSNSNSNSKKSNVTMTTLFTHYSAIGLGNDYPPTIYKEYCYKKYNVESMKDLSQEQLEEQNNILLATVNNEERKAKFREVLNGFKEQSQQTSQAQDEKQSYIKNVVDKLAGIHGQDNDAIGYELSRMCTEISHPGDLNKLTLAQLKSIEEMVDMKVEMAKEEILVK